MQAPKTEGVKRELVPTGNHMARLYEIIYIGTIDTGYKNDDGSDKFQYKVRLTWELPTELRTFGTGEDEKEMPMVTSKECTFSLFRGKTQTAILRTIAHALIGEAITDEEAGTFDIKDLLGKACMMEIEHDEYQGNKYAKAVGFGSVPKGVEVPAQVNESREKSVSELTKEEIDELPEFIRNKMTGSREYHVRFLAPRSENPEVDLPQAVKDEQDKEVMDSPF